MTTAFHAAESPPTSLTSTQENRDSLVLFLVLPTCAMSLGWALRGTIGGGQIGAMIPGAMVMFCLCHLLGWHRSLGIVAALGTVGIGLGGQETYGQTIGFLRDSETLWRGLLGNAIKGGMWGLSGGVLVGLGFMHTRYRRRDIAFGLLLMVVGTVLGREFIDRPKFAYFSSGREEVWVGITCGALLLWMFLALQGRETVTTWFAWGGCVAGAAGFGGGSLFLAYGANLDPPYRGWPCWKMMEFTFGACYGLGLGAVAYGLRTSLRTQHAELSRCDNDIDRLPDDALLALGWLTAVGGLWLNFYLSYRAAFSLIAPGLILLALRSSRLAWHVALSLTICGFVRDYFRGGAERHWFEAGYAQWPYIALVSVPIVGLVVLADRKQKLTPVAALLTLTWVGTVFGLIRVGLPQNSKHLDFFVPGLFVLELLVTTVLLRYGKRNHPKARVLPA